MCVVVQWNLEHGVDLAFDLQFLKVFDALSGSLNLSEKHEYHMMKSGLIVDVHALIAKVLIAATTSRDPPSM